MMAASLDYVTEDEHIEYFDPFGQMDYMVRQTLLKLARKERAEAVAAQQNIDDRYVHDEPYSSSHVINGVDKEFYGHYSF